VYRPAAHPALWAAAAETVALVSWWAIGGPGCLLAVAAAAAGFAVKAAVHVRNHPVAVKQNTGIALAAATVWALVASLAGPFWLWPLPVLQLALLAGTVILGRRYYNDLHPPGPAAHEPAPADPAALTVTLTPPAAPPPATTAPAPWPPQSFTTPAPPAAASHPLAAEPAPPPGYTLPPVTLLTEPPAGLRSGRDPGTTAMIMALGGVFRQFGVDATVSGHTTGPAVTLYEITLGEGVKVEKVRELARNIALAAATPDVRILDVIPGKQAMGIEIPNANRRPVTLASLMAAIDAAAHPLTVPVGADVAGAPVIDCLAAMPHVIVGGATGSGKTTQLLAWIAALLLRATPDELRFLMIDPKRVELAVFRGIPHLVTDVITSPRRAAEGLAWAVGEMDRRYADMAATGFRHIDDFNAACRAGTITQAPDDGRDAYKPYPYLAVVVDELSDLMMEAPREVEDCLVRLEQLGRAAGVHCILATQHPITKVVTSLVKANAPSRLAFATADNNGSRVILDETGAETLIGAGDGLWKPAGAHRAIRVQGAWVSEGDVRKIVDAVKTQPPAKDYPGPEFTGPDTCTPRPAPPPGPAGAVTDRDELALLYDALGLVVDTQFGSTSMLQRKLRAGFAKAGRLMDLLEAAGVVGPSEGAKARDVLITDPAAAEAAVAGKYGPRPGTE
jgi:S-DNA-T family DNA segregation ATPase FtsK/SpoIIIE